MYKLYYSPGACSMAIHVLLNELNAPFELEKVVLGEKNRTPEYLKLNPLGQVPVLVEDGKPLREGGAQIIYLADKHKSPLMPQEGWPRAQALQALMFCNATLHPAYSKLFGLLKAGDIAGKDEFIRKAAGHINALWKQVEADLENQPYMAGQQVTVADILLTVIANWSNGLPGPIEIGPKAKALFAKIVARPSFQKAMETEGVSH
jgi:glutathione S-transferase